MAWPSALLLLVILWLVMSGLGLLSLLPAVRGGSAVGDSSFVPVLLMLSLPTSSLLLLNSSLLGPYSLKGAAQATTCNPAQSFQVVEVPCGQYEPC